jgi:amino acid adenylation domain-containing protein
MHEDGGSLKGSLEYSTDLFDETTSERMLGHFEVLLQSIATDPGQQLDKLSLLTADEERHLLVDLNATNVDYPLGNFIHQQFEAQVAHTPDAVALVFGDEQVSYRELGRRVNQLAHFLRGLGVGPEVLVGIMMERSLEMVVGLMGVLKAGGAYVPLEPSYPKDRLAYITRDARVSVILTQERLLGALQVGTVRVIAVDKEWPTIALCSTENPISLVSGGNLAYVIYTSGSTGRPKGVMIPHRGLANYLSWCTRRYDVEKGRGSPVHSSLSFDLTVTGLFPPLLTGKTVFLVSEAEGIEGLAAALLKRDNYSLVKITPAHLSALSEQLSAEKIRGRVGALVIGGEALHMENLSFWRKYAPETKLINEYGPTETVVGCCVYEVLPDDPQASAVPIGRPIANTQIYLLNERLRPVPIGVAGELHIGGIDLARGYLNSADLTAERFIPNPFSAEPGARLYRTGDSARYLADSTLVYLDRLDSQVKIRGFRIEPGEIEAVLRQDGRVRDVLVLAREDKAGEKSLVAYVVAEHSELPEIEQLRRHLKEKLPAYMVPAHFVFLDVLPLTTSGKVDRRALPGPAPGNPALAGSYASPANQMEEILADIWASVLGLERVGRDDDFFDLGGHSLLATKLLYRIQEALGVALPLRRIFDGPTVAAAAKTIENLMQTGSAPVLTPIRHLERDRELPLSFAQQRLWILEQLAPDTYNEHSAIRLRGTLNVSALEQSLNEIIRRHEILRTTFVAVDGRPAQTIAASLTLPLPLIDLRHLTRTGAEEQVVRLAVEERRRSFDLTQGPLLRVTLLRPGEDEHVVLLSLHHIVFDGWSNAILIQEAATLYEAFSGGLPSPLPDLPVQYADFAVWQRQWLQNEILDAHLAYWKKQLDGAPIALQLPLDRPKPQIPTLRGASLPLRFPAALADDLRVLSRQEGVTLFMTLLTIFKILLYSYSGQDDIVVGTNVANRTRGETEKLIGFFVNLLVLRTDLSGAPSFRDLLSRVREVTLKALAHQDLPFEKLVGELKLDRGSDHTPLVQAVMQLHTAPRVALELSGLTQEFLEIGIETVPFDLVLNMAETDDGLVGAWLYNTDLFEAGTIARMAGRFELLLNQLVVEPDMNLNEIVAMLKDAERQQRKALQEDFKNTRRMKLRSVKLQPVVGSNQ